MRETYLLPCDCGRETPVEATQSGQEITCQCGRRIEVPTLRKLSSLKRGRPDKKGQPPASTWGTRQAVLLLGIIITLCGLTWTGYLGYNRPRIVPIRDLTLLQTWAVWHQEFLPGVRQAPPWEEHHLARTKWYRRWLGVAGAIAVLGVVTMATSFLIPKRGPRRRKRPGPKPPAGPRPPAG